MKLVKSILFPIFFISLSSCSSFVDGMYRDLDRQERAHADSDMDSQNRDLDQFEQYRKNNKRRTSQVYNKPGRHKEENAEVSTNTQNVVNPNVKRQYQDERVALKRTTASDLTDNGNDGSLWSSKDPQAFLFATSRSKNSGDIVQINVLTKLRNEITMELKRAFPDNPYDKPKGKESPTPPTTEAAASPAAAPDTAQDKISSVVIEEINREHLLLKGRKNVLFKNKKRMVEVQALVSRKDIADDDSVSSDSILETSVSVVR